MNDQPASINVDTVPLGVNLSPFNPGTAHMSVQPAPINLDTVSMSV